MTDVRSETRSIRFELLPDDLAVFSEFQLSRSPRFLRQRRLGLVLPPLLWLIAWAAYVMLSDNPEETASQLWWLLLYAPIHFFLHHWRWQRNLGQLKQRLLHESKKSPLLGKRRMTLTSEKVSEKNPLSEIAATWAQVQKLERMEAHTFLFLSPTAALIVPRRAFESEAAYAEFVQFAQAQMARVSPAAHISS